MLGKCKAGLKKRGHKSEDVEKSKLNSGRKTWRVLVIHATKHGLKNRGLHDVF